MTERIGPDVTACTRCPDLVACRTQIVNGRGDERADLVAVGEAPGRVEDELGRPFVGRSGDILEATLDRLGVDPDRVRITNCVRCRPPDNRDPRVGERNSCRDHLETEVAHVDPVVILALGRIPTAELVGGSRSVTECVGETVEVAVGGARRPVVIGLHPAATLYDRTKRPAFEAAVETAVDLAGLR